ncbi:HD domain-containing protein [Thioclava sp. FR2]|uniref:HD domain-containing protein n=1 Tax=Thioclava sp. FR2 TaxID=3445780 RepID=UPI003EBECBF7
MTTIEVARAFAAKAHEGQTRKGQGQEPYFVHLEEVAALVAQFGGSSTAVMAAWLHDTVEDCGVTSAEISRLFGPKVAAIVAELTDDKALEKAERKRMQILNAPGKSPEAALVKLCDKLSNVRAVGNSPPVHWPIERKRAYVDWAETVVQALPELSAEARAAFDAVVAQTRETLA